jgi:hypothetical protein
MRGGDVILTCAADLIILLSAVVTLFCMIWVGWGVYIARSVKPVLALKTQFRPVGLPDGSGDRIAEVRVIIFNTTPKRVNIGKMDFTARGVDKKDCVQSEAGVQFLKFPIPIVRKRPMIPDMWIERYIEPKQRVLYKGMMVVPAHISYVNIIIHFDGEDPNVEFASHETIFAMK